MNWPHDDIMNRARLRVERRLAWQQRRWVWQQRIAAAIWLLAGMAAGMALVGWVLYG